MIRLADIEKVYRTEKIETVALANVNMDVAPGEFVAIMGPSGSGKSTFMNVLGCLDRPLSGSYSLDGGGKRAAALNPIFGRRLHLSSRRIERRGAAHSELQPHRLAVVRGQRLHQLIFHHLRAEMLAFRIQHQLDHIALTALQSAVSRQLANDALQIQLRNDRTPIAIAYRRCRRSRARRGLRTGCRARPGSACRRRPSRWRPEARRAGGTGRLPAR